MHVGRDILKAAKVVIQEGSLSVVALDAIVYHLDIISRQRAGKLEHQRLQVNLIDHDIQAIILPGHEVRKGKLGALYKLHGRYGALTLSGTKLTRYGFVTASIVARALGTGTT